jgi:hypothetical protein
MKTTKIDFRTTPELAAIIKGAADIAFPGVKRNLSMYAENVLEKESYYFSCYHMTGRKVMNKNSGRNGVILKIFPSGSVQVLESIDPYVICTHDNFNTLQLID